jgi:hypothetical protein
MCTILNNNNAVLYALFLVLKCLVRSSRRDKDWDAMETHAHTYDQTLDSDS